MSGPVLQILKSYSHFSIGEVVLWFCFYCGMILTLGFGLPTYFFEGPFFEAIHNPFFLMLFPFLVAATVNSRLVSLNDYSLAFVTPDYRRYHLKVGMGLIVIFGWIPMLLAMFFGSNDLAANLGVLVSCTGVVLLITTSVSALLRNVLNAFCVVLMIIFLILGLQYSVTPRWEAPLWLSLSLLVIGILLIVFFIRGFLAGREYGEFSASSGWGSNNPAEIWVKYNMINGATTDSIGEPILTQFISLVLKSRISVYRRQGTNEAMTKLVSCVHGEEPWYWIYLTICGLAFILLLLLMVFVESQEKWLALIIFGGVAFSCLAFGVLSLICSPSWSVANIWLRSRVANKQEVLNRLIQLRIRFGMGLLLIAVLSLVVPMELLIKNNNDFLSNEIIRLYSMTLLFVVIGGIFFGVGIRLVLHTLSRGWAEATMFVFPISIFGIFIGVQNYILPYHLQVANIPASLVFFISSILFLSIVSPWAYKGYFRRRDYIA